MIRARNGGNVDGRAFHLRNIVSIMKTEYNMFTKRTFVTLAAATLIAACSNVTDINRAKSDTGPLKLNSVRVDVSSMKTTSKGRDIKRTRAQFADDLTAALARELGPVSDPNGLPADVNVKVNEIYLARIVDRVLAGTSYIESTASVTDAASGDEIVAPVDVRGDSDQFRAAGPVAVVTTGSLDNDYQAAINGYAKALVASLVASK